jgi:hypothetical protein
LPRRGEKETAQGKKKCEKHRRKRVPCNHFGRRR